MSDSSHPIDDGTFLIKSCKVCGDSIYVGKDHPALCHECSVCPYCDSDQGFVCYPPTNTFVCQWCGATFEGTKRIELEVQHRALEKAGKIIKAAAK